MIAAMFDLEGFTSLVKLFFGIDPGTVPLAIAFHAFSVKNAKARVAGGDISSPQRKLWVSGPK